MLIRSIKPADLGDLLPLCIAHAQHEGFTLEDRGQQERWRGLLFGDRPTLFGWVVEDDGQLVGYMTATIDTSTWSARRFLYLDCLYLQPHMRRQGIGRRMMTVLAEFASASACQELQWQTPPDNAQGIAFYRSLGAGELPKVRFRMGARP